MVDPGKKTHSYHFPQNKYINTFDISNVGDGVIAVYLPLTPNLTRKVNYSIYYTFFISQYMQKKFYVSKIEKKDN